MPTAQGVLKQLRYGKEATWGTLPGVGTGKLLPRTESAFNLEVDTYQSGTIRTDLQADEARQGFRKAVGEYKDDVTAGGLVDFLSAALRGPWSGSKVAPLVAKTGTPANEKTGKTLIVPATGHTADSFSFEEWFPDISVSKRYTGLRVAGIDFDLPPTGMATVTIKFLGQNRASGTAAYFTAPASITRSVALAAVNGKLLFNGAAVGLVTGAKISIDCNAGSEPVLGQNTAPDVNLGRVTASGSFTMLMQDKSLSDMLDNETATSLAIRMDAGSADAADYLAIVLPRIKIGSDPADDGEKGIVQTVNFTASPGTFNSLTSTIIFQDTLA